MVCHIQSYSSIFSQSSYSPKRRQFKRSFNGGNLTLNWKLQKDTHKSSFKCYVLISVPSFGARYRSTRTGIIYNNEMDDFSTPGLLNAYGVYPSESNMIYPGKRPQSSTAPSIFLDGDGVARLVIGASGGTKITTAISLVRWHQFLFYDNQKKNNNNERIHSVG